MGLLGDSPIVLEGPLNTLPSNSEVVTQKWSHCFAQLPGHDVPPPQATLTPPSSTPIPGTPSGYVTI